MHSRSVVSRFRSETDAAWQKVFEEVSARLQNDAAADVEALIADYPLYAERLRDLLPVMQAMAEMGRVTGFSAGVDSADATSADGGLVGEDAKPGRTLGDFRLIRELGRGGMGVVYEAEQISLGRRVALKVLPFAAILDERQLVRFKNEARAAATLHHTNIVPVFSVGCERGVHFYAMQYIEGYTLAQVITALRAQNRIQSGKHKTPVNDDSPPTVPFVSSGDSPTADPRPLNPASSDTVRDDILATVLSEHQTDRRAHYRTIAKLGIQAAEALEHAHQHGIVHRDVKPANMMLDTSGNLWITDFGLARLETDAGMTMTGDLVGTLRYMSPEQALGKRVTIDERTDIYSLGVTLYELLTSAPPFEGTSRADVLRHISFTDAVPPRQREGRIPRELETIVLKALAKRPIRRYNTMQALADDLQRYLTEQPILARPTPYLIRVAKWIRRHRAAVATGMTLVCAILVAWAVAQWLVREGRHELAQQDQQRTKARATFSIAENMIEQLASSPGTLDSDAAEAQYRKALGLMSPLVMTEQCTSADLCSYIFAKARFGKFLISRAPGEADILLRSLIDPISKIGADEDLSLPPNARVKYARTSYFIAEHLASQGDFGQAELLYRDTVTILSPLQPDYEDICGYALMGAGDCCRESGKLAEAAEAYAAALPFIDRNVSRRFGSPRFGPSKRLPYPNVFDGQGAPTIGRVILIKAKVQYYLGELVTAESDCVGAAFFIGRDDPNASDLELCRRTAKLVGVNVEPYLSSQNSDLTYRSGFDVNIENAYQYTLAGRQTAAYDLFELTLYQSLETCVPVRRSPRFFATAELLEKQGALRLIRIHALLDADDHIGVAAECDQFVIAFPNDAKVLWLRGATRWRWAEALTLQGHKADAMLANNCAVESLEAAIRAAPDFGRSYAELAWVRGNAATDYHLRPNDAIDLAKKAMETDWGSFTARAALVGAYYQLGMWQESVKAFDDYAAQTRTSNVWEPVSPVGFLGALSAWHNGQLVRSQTMCSQTTSILERYGTETTPLAIRLRNEAERLMDPSTKSSQE